MLTVTVREMKEETWFRTRSYLFYSLSIADAIDTLKISTTVFCLLIVNFKSDFKFKLVGDSGVVVFEIIVSPGVRSLLSSRGQYSQGYVRFA